MPTLQVRDLPAEVHQKLVEAAAREHRSLAQQATVLLAQSLGAGVPPRERRQAHLKRIAATGVRVKYPHGAKPEELIRQDRDR